MLLVAGLSGAIQQTLQAWRRYDERPVVITVEKDFFNWLVEFPSVIICLGDMDLNLKKKLIPYFKL